MNDETRTRISLVATRPGQASVTRASLSISVLAAVGLVCALLIAPRSLRSQVVDTKVNRPAECPMGVAEPAPVRDLEPTTLHYRGTFSAGATTMAITSTLVVAPHPAGGWAVVERAQLPRGLAVDSARLDAGSLAPRERTISQGPVRIALAFTNDSATGTSTMGAQVQPIAAKLCGTLLGDGAGAFLVVGRLPLAEGYHTALRHFDAQKGTTTEKQLVVVGGETVSIAAGTFDTWKVEVTDAGAASPTTIWVDRKSLVPVKFSSSQGPVTVAMELDR